MQSINRLLNVTCPWRGMDDLSSEYLVLPVKPHSKPSEDPAPSTKRIDSEPLENLRGSNSNENVPPRRQRFLDHGLEESPEEARARFHLELLDRVRQESRSQQPARESENKDLLETIDVWEASIWSGLDAGPKG